MSIERILSNPELIQAAKPKPKAEESGDFAGVLKQAISEVNQLQNAADDQIAGLMKGESKDLHGTVLAVQRADSSFRMMMAVRNKIVEAYKEISKSAI
ncbi:flagellar hook-basal body complex protein FliE [Acanthopleuribacter pedis]|uniref:Flagellar hook-basal body complex protein FliE n=1 Tax=Acanthopleuribacter pedis TaxID=442870 RepID=A0A8J7QB27_9BACT|nr:flagellar hook-basal body complex protein FliE [Acanthopleuribacter pedis]MBO1317576.1 flagellar hook-basal body complex protein FliE [Acanthopleuribacter pedis]